MRRMSWLLPVLAGCAGADGSPVRVAERFHARLAAGDDGGVHALLTEEDRVAIPLEAFPDALPPGLTLALFAWGEGRLESASLLSEKGDTALVVLHAADGAPDTLRLRATHDPIGLWRFKLDRVRWRVALGLAERALLDSLAAAMRANAEASATAGVEQAEAYLRVAERNPALADPAELSAARSMVRRAAIAEALAIELRVVESFTGATVIEGRIENPTGTRIRTLRLIVRDGAGAEERVDLWEIAPGATTPVRQMTRLRTGPVTYRLERIQAF